MYTIQKKTNITMTPCLRHV